MYLKVIRVTLIPVVSVLTDLSSLQRKFQISFFSLSLQQQQHQQPNYSLSHSVCTFITILLSLLLPDLLHSCCFHSPPFIVYLLDDDVLLAYFPNLIFCPSFPLLAMNFSAGDKSIILWNPGTGQLINRLEGHTRYVTCCVFSHDNRLLASGSNDKNVIIWNLSDIARSLNDNDECRPVTARKRRGSQEESNILNSANAVSKWSSDDVANWVHQLGLSQFEDVFRSNEVDGQELLHLTHDTLLTSLKIGLLTGIFISFFSSSFPDALGHRNKLLRGVQSLRNPLWQHINTSIEENVSLPQELKCPITHEAMTEPVVAAGQ